MQSSMQSSMQSPTSATLLREPLLRGSAQRVSVRVQRQPSKERVQKVLFEVVCVARGFGCPIALWGSFVHGYDHV